MNSEYWFKQVSQKTAKDKAGDFFEKRCVLNLTYDERQCDWHHLDENSENNPRIGNLVPISRNLNQAIETARRTKSNLPKELHTDKINSAARENWDKGELAHCYGTNRLGSFLEKNYRDNPSQSLLFAAEALHSLRPLSAQEFAVDTIYRSILPLVSDRRYNWRLTPESLASLCKEVASWFLCSGIYGKFYEWKALGEKFADAFLITDPDSSTIIYARLIQHHGFTLYQCGDLAAAERLIEAAVRLMNNVHYEHGDLNNYQYLMRVKLQKAQQSGASKDLDEALILLDNCEKRFGKIKPLKEWSQTQAIKYEYWAGVGLMQIKAETAYYRRRNFEHKDVAQMFESVADLLKQKNIKAMGGHPISKGVNEFVTRYESAKLHLMPYLQVPVLCRDFYIAAAKLIREIYKITYSPEWEIKFKTAKEFNRAFDKRR